VLELLLATAVLGVALALALPSFARQAEKAHDLAARSSIASGHKIAKLVWARNGGRYPELETLLLGMLEEEPEAFSYRASIDGYSKSKGPKDLSISLDETRAWITICARSQTLRTYCGRFHDRAPYAESLWAVGTGENGEEDAKTALPDAVAPATSDAGPGDTGTPLGGAGGSESPSPSESGPQAPLLVWAATPPAQTQATSASFAWQRSGGPVSEQRCLLDQRPVPCALPALSAALEALSVGAHSFSVWVVGPGGSDLLSYVWEVVNPPSDRLVVANDGDYALAFYPSSAKPTGAFEVGAWVNLFAEPTGAGATIVSHGCSWANGQHCRQENAGWSLVIDHKLRVEFTVPLAGGGWRSQDSGSGRLRGPAPALTLGVWHYVSGSYDPDGRLCTWVDGVLQACSGPNNGRRPLVASDGPLVFGGQPNPSENDLVKAFLRGAIGEARMTRDGGPAHPLVVGPRSQPAQLFSPAENGRPATWLYHFDDASDSMGALGALELRGDAYLSPAF
jgi:hypothetical protein